MSQPSETSSTALQHRCFLPHPEAHHPFDAAFFARIGGSAAIESLIERLYQRIETDAALRPLFGRDLSNEREGQRRFFTEWLGGEAIYSRHAHLPLKHRHDLLPITPELADAWLAHFRAALEGAVRDPAARHAIEQRICVLAAALVNEGEPASALRAHPHGACLRYTPAATALDLARRGEVTALGDMLTRAPDVMASTPHAAKMLQVAILSDRRAVVELLLERGVDADKPSPIQPLIFLTPLCAARMKRRHEIEAILLHHGAKQDIFTHAFLGDLASLDRALSHDPESAQATDPAVDALEITPVHHAVAGDRLESLRMLVSRTPHGPLRGADRALAVAVEHANPAITAVLLAHGADATTIAAGRWVLHRELASLLARAGARIDRSGSWIHLSCTGNQGRKDDPEYVAALLRHGAHVDDRRLTRQQTDGGRATALHYASKAGFARTIELLLEHGADPTARDDNGLTPLDWLARAAKSVDRDAIRRLLQPPRAN